MKHVIFLLHIVLLSSMLHAQQLAFPSAEGFGKYASGGRGGEVYHVTNLNDSGSGSFRNAVSQPDRTVVFDIGGVIKISSRIVVSENITIAGQTAPGEGITIYGNGLSYSNANNTITRYIRIRMGKIGDSGKDAVAIAEGQNMIFDHVSISWGRDGTFDLNGDVGNVTLQNSIIAQGLQTHSTGGLVQSTGGISILRCLYIDNHTRNPKVKGYNQYINNVVYDWAVAGYILGDSEGYSEANVLNNYFISGPETSSLPFNRANENFHLYANGNFWDENLNGVLDGSEVDTATYGPVTWSSTPFDQPTVTLLTAEQAYSYVFQHVGASIYRDQVDTLLIGELASLGTKGSTISDETDLPTNGPGIVSGGPSYPDADADGMPDYYEIALGLQYDDASDSNNDTDLDGYTNLEEYLNCLAGDCDTTMPSPPARTPQTFVFTESGSSSRWDDVSNWNLGYLPAAGDTVIIQSGTAQIKGDKSGIIVRLPAGSTLNVAGKTSLEWVFLEGGILSGSDTLLAGLSIELASQVNTTENATFYISGQLLGNETIYCNAFDKMVWNTQGEDFTGNVQIISGHMLASTAHPFGDAYIEIKKESVLELSNSGISQLTFLEIEQDGMLILHHQLQLSGGKFGDQSLMRSHSYSQDNMPDFISGTGAIQISSKGKYDCTGTWNGTAIIDACLTCVGGTTDRLPCDTTFSTGAYKLTNVHSELCIQIDEEIVQDTCKTTSDQAIDLIKKGNVYQIRHLRSQKYVVPFSLDENGLNMNKLSISPLPVGYFRIEKAFNGYLLTPALRPDVVFSIEDSSVSSGASISLYERMEIDSSQLFNINPYYDCSGVRGGLAEIDSCGFCAGGDTGQTPCTSSFEAEAFCLLDGEIESDPERDYSGEGYLNFDNVTGSRATYNLHSNKADTVQLQIRYANGSSNRPLQVLVNDQVQIENLDFPTTDDWNNWYFLPLELMLDTGDNYIELVSKSSAGAANIDQFILFTEEVGLVTCPPIDCNGTPYGNATLDSCGFCTGGTTGINPCMGQWEAENYCEMDGIIEAIEGRGYSGEGYLNLDNVTGSKVTYQVKSTKDQNTTLWVRYANGSGNRPVQVVVNDSIQHQNIDFPSTGGWANWNFAGISLQLLKDNNYVELISTTSSGAANIDLFIYTDSLTLEPCPETDCFGDIGGIAEIDSCGVCSGGNTGTDINSCLVSSDSNEMEQVFYYPNTFSDELTLESENAFSYEVYDENSSKLLLKGKAEHRISIGGNLSAGNYILHILRNERVLIKTMVIKQ